MRINNLLGVLVTLGVLLGMTAACTTTDSGPSKSATSVATTGAPFTGLMPHERLASRQASASVVPTVSASAVHSAAAYRWKNVGGDPCNPKAGCTLQWALDRAVAAGHMPRDVADEFLRIVPNTPGEEVLIPVGVLLDFGTWGKFTPTFVSQILTDFRDGQPQPAKKWTVYRPQVLPYDLLQFRACGNWAGKRGSPQGPLSDIPQAYCE